MQARLSVLNILGLTALPLLAFLTSVGAGAVRRVSYPLAAALVVGLLAAALLALHGIAVTPETATVWQRLLLAGVLPVGAAVPLLCAAAVFHGTRHRGGGMRLSAALATWLVTLPIGLFIAFFVGCAGGLVCF